MPARILVVDDEKVVLDLVYRALSVCGYEVVCTADPVQALATAAASPRVDLILSDVVMPGMRGPELLRKVREASPDIPALLMSGFDVTDVPADVPFISKPFKVQDLVRSVQELLSLARPQDGHKDRRPKQARAAGSIGGAGQAG